MTTIFTPKRQLLSILPLAIAGLAGCGSDSDSPPLPLIKEVGYLHSGLLENVPYTCGGQQGRTGRLGHFIYEVGRTCTFKFGDMHLEAAVTDLGDGVVTLYDLTASKTEAWALMAILDSLSFGRPGTDEFIIVDQVLTQRLNVVDLGQGDAAIAMALQPYNGKTKAVSLASGRERLGEFVDENNKLTEPLQDSLDRGKAVLGNLGVDYQDPTPDGDSPKDGDDSPGLLGETNHDNRVNLVIYDYQGNPLAIDNFWMNNNWLSVSDGQNPDNNEPQIGMDEGDISGPNVIGIDLVVGRHQTSDVANDYQSYLNDGGFSSPVTIFAADVIDENDPDESQSNNTHLGQQLNFGFGVDLGIDTPNGNFYCNDFSLAQGSNDTWKALFDTLKDLADTFADLAKFIASDGDDLPEAAQAVQSYTKFTQDAQSIAFQNWWMLGLGAQNGSYRASAWGDPAIMMQCYLNGSGDPPVSVPVLAYSDYDDHTFNLQVSFPPQNMTVQE